jgi:predicted acyl esterase
MNREFINLIKFAVILFLFSAGCSNSNSGDGSATSEEAPSLYLVADAGPDRKIDIPGKTTFVTPVCDAESIQWDFGDGENDQGYEVEHKYNAAGKYNVRVTVTGTDGQSAEDTCIVTVYPKDTDGDLLQDSIDGDPKNGDINSPRKSAVFFLKSFDGEELECRLYLPKGEPPFPVIMIGHGWDSDLDEMDGRAKNYRDAGYVTFVWSARGWGNSTGLVRLDSTKYEIKDTIRLINWLAEQKFVIEESRPEWFFDNGKIINYDFNQDNIEENDDIPGDETRDFVLGMNGCSYGGALQVLTASYDHRIDCISPERTWNNLLDALCPGESLKILWAGGFYLQGMARSLKGTGVDPMLTDFIFTLLLENEFKPGMKDELMMRSPSTRTQYVLAPALFIQGEYDTVFDLNQAIANLEQIQANGIEAKMHWYAGGHGYMPENPPYNEEIVLKWMDRHLRGMNVDTGPEVSYDIVGPDGNAARYSGNWPLVEKGGEMKLMLHSSEDGHFLKCSDNDNGKIILDASALDYDGESDSDSFKNIPLKKTSLSEIQAIQGMLTDPPDPFDSTETSVTFESEPFAEDSEITGVPLVELYLSSNSTDITYFIKLYDVPPGSSINSDDNLGAKKINADARVLNNGVTPLRVYTEKAKAVKGNLQFHKADLRAMACFIKKGHRIRLTISTSDYFFLQSRKPGTAFLWHDHENQSCLRLPVVEKASR